MAKIKKKGTSGEAKNYITRTRAVRKLQVSLPDFRRLCIFKGIYPREPRSTKKSFKSATPSTTFYYTKDIQYLLHEPLLQKFREHKALSKKIARYLGRNEVGDAARLEKSGQGKLRLDHIIKERYPMFVDALRDLDDALSMLFLFANLPSNSAIPPKTIATCQKLCNEFLHFIIVSHSLRKSFLSIKGIYYQATVQGQDIMWLVPYRFVQRVTEDVDFRIMSTFVEFYIALLGFVNYRLYTTIGLRYPPKLDTKSDELGGELGALKLEGVGVSSQQEQPKQLEVAETEESRAAQVQIQEKVDELTRSMGNEVAQEDTITAEDVPDDAHEIDTFEPAEEGADTLIQPQISNAEAGSLFAPFTFFLSRESPRQPLEFILRSFGCKRIAWDAVLGDGAFTNNELDSAITHQIVDRPVLIQSAPDAMANNGDAAPTANMRVPGRLYLQPQWVWDCINAGKLLRADLYGPGVVLPPHLSPWIKPRKGEYDPTLPLEAQEKEGEAEEAALQEAIASGAHDAEDTSGLMDGEDDAEEDEEDEDELNGIDEEAEEDEDEVEGDDFADFQDMDGGDVDAKLNAPEEDGDEEAMSEEDLDTDLVDANSDGKPPLRSILKSTPQDAARRKAEQKRMAEDEEVERRKGMMSRKKRKLYERMVHGNKKRDDEAAALRAKRRKVEDRRQEPAPVKH